MRTAAYLRVSTDRQDHANQRPEVMNLATSRGNLVATYEETESTTKHRPQYEALMLGARRREFDMIVFWSLDRFGRSMWETVGAVKELDRIGIKVLSVKEPWFDTSGPVRDLLLAIFSWVAEHERERLRERTKAGLARARANGTKLGTPEIYDAGTRAEAARLRSERRMSWAQIAQALGCSRSQARRMATIEAI